MCSFFLARFRPSSWDWLNDRSLNFPISLTSAARNVALLAFAEAWLELLPTSAARPASTSTAPIAAANDIRRDTILLPSLR